MHLVVFGLLWPFWIHAAPWGAEARDRLDRAHQALEKVRALLADEADVESIEVGTRDVGTGIVVSTSSHSAERRLLARFPHEMCVDDVPLIVESAERRKAMYDRVRERVAAAASGHVSAEMRYPSTDPPYLEIGFAAHAPRVAFETFYPSGSIVDGIRVVAVTIDERDERRPKSMGNRFRRFWEKAFGGAKPATPREATESLKQMLAAEFPKARVEEGERGGRTILGVAVESEAEGLALLAKFPAGRRHLGYEVRINRLPAPPSTTTVRAHQTAVSTALALAPDLQRRLASIIPDVEVGVSEHEGRPYFAVFVRDKEDAFELAKLFPEGSDYNGFAVRLSGLPIGTTPDSPRCQPSLEN